jgi:hypothetical protein
LFISTLIKSSILSLGLIALSASAFADDVEGQIEAIDTATQTITVLDKPYTATEATEYEDTLKGFSDLKVGERIEVDYAISRSGQLFITEIELDD